MFWREGQRNISLKAPLPRAYSLRTYRQGDEPRFFEMIESVGWPGWDDEKLAPWLPRILPEGWFFVFHKGTGETVATCMAMSSDAHPNGGELGWLACDPAHQGKGLGLTVSAAVTKRFLDAGYTTIHLYTEHYRLAAIKTYLKLGYVPWLFSPEISELWQAICLQLNWAFKPKAWGS